MSFLLSCPNCGKRHVGEFQFRGEYRPRPEAWRSHDSWVDYVYLNDNRKGLQREWWYHIAGCQRWFVTERDTRTNAHTSYWLEDLPARIAPSAEGRAAAGRLRDREEP